MITIKYKSVIIDGQDKTGKTETVTLELGLRLVNQGYAELVMVQSPETIATTPPPEQCHCEILPCHCEARSNLINPEDLPFNSPLYLEPDKIYGEDGPVEPPADEKPKRKKR